MGTGEGLAASERVQRLQTVLHAKAKEAPDFRFYSLSDKVWREDVLAVAWQAVRRNGGSAGVDGETVADVESRGVDGWLGALARDLKAGTYRPRAVRQVLMFSVNYFCRLASTIFAGSGRRESRSTTMTPVGRVGVACDVQSGVENALPRRCTVAPLLGRVFHAAGAVHGLLGFRSIPAFRRSTVGGRGAAADPEHVPGGTGAAGISGGTGPCSSSGRRTQACSA